MADQRLNIQLTAIDRTRRAFASVNSGLTRVKNSIFSVQSAITALVAGAGIAKFAEQIDDLAKTSRRLGLTVNELQSLQFAAEQTGVSAEQLTTALDRFNRNISETALGTGIAKRSFEDLGVSVQDQQGNLRDTNDIFNDVADALQGIESPATRTRIAMDLFGRSGADLVNTLSDGSNSINQLRREFDSLTIELDQTTAMAVEAANDRFNRLSKSISSVAMNIGALALDGLSKTAEMATIEFMKLQRDALAHLGFDEKAAEIDRMITGMQHAAIASFDLEQAQKNETAEVEKAVPRLDIYGESLNKIAKAQREVAKQTHISGKALADYAKAARDVKEMSLDAAARGIERLEDSLVDVAMQTTTVKDAFKNMAKSILSDLVRIGIQRQITAPLAGAIFGQFGGASVPFGASGRAIGGSVQAGQPYMVGERGKELFVPNQSGAIIPNDKMGVSGGVVVNQTINLSAGVSQTVRAEVMNMMPQIANAAKGAVIDAKRRGGTFGSAFGA